MPERDAAKNRIPGKNEQNRLNLKSKSPGTSQKPVTRDIAEKAIGETPFNPPLQQHASALSSASPENRVIIIQRLQQTYGNRYVQRLVNTINTPNRVSPNGEPAETRITAKRPASNSAGLKKPQAHRQNPPGHAAVAITHAKPLNNQIFSKPETLTKPAETSSSLVIGDTFLFRPKLKGNAPQPAGLPNSRVGEKIGKGAHIELFDVKSPLKKPKWQLAKHPESGEKGFILLNRILTGNTLDLKTDIGSANPKDVSDALGDLFGGVGGVNDQAFDQAANIIILRDPSLAWTQESGDINTEGLKDSVKKHIPWLSNALKNDVTGVTGAVAGFSGDVAGGISGLIGMAQGMSAAFNSKSEMNDRLDGMFKVGAGSLGMIASVVGLGGTTVSTIAQATTKPGSESPLGDLITGVLKPLGDGVKTVKGVVETAGLLLKGFLSLIDRAKKGASTKIAEILAFLAEFAGSAIGTLKSAFNTAAGILQWLKTLPGVSTIFGLIGSVMDIVSGACDLVKNTIEVITMGSEMKENKEKQRDLEKDPEYKHTERNMLNKLNRLAKTPVHSLKLSKDNKPDTGQITGVLQQYEKKPAKNKSERTEQDYKEVSGYLVDRNLEEALNKRVKRSWSRIPEYGMGIAANVVSISGGLVSVGADIAGIIAAPSGVGLAITSAVKAIASISSGIVSGILKTGKALYGVGRAGVRKIKQTINDKSRWGNRAKSSKSKQENRLKQTKLIMFMVFDLKRYDLSKKDTPKEYDRVKFRLEATGVDLKTLFSLNGKPAEQAQEIYKALAKRE